MLQDLLNGYFTVEAISSVAVQIVIVTILTQLLKNIVKGKVRDCWFPVLGIAVGIVTQLIIFLGICEIDRYNFIQALFHGTLFGVIGCGTYDIGDAIDTITSQLPLIGRKKDTQNKLEEIKTLEKTEIEEQQEFENWAHH